MCRHTVRKRRIKMDFEQLQLFIKVTKEGSFDRVAEQNYSTQRIISRKINKLEKELGVTLFLRKSNSISLTRAGIVFADEVQEYLRKMNQTISNLHELQNNDLFNLKIGYYSMFDGVLMRDQILTYQQAKGHLHITFLPNEENIERILADLTLRNIDLGYINEYGIYNFINRNLFSFISIFRGQMKLGVSKLNPLCKKEIITEKELSKENLLFYNSEKTDYFEETFYSTLKAKVSNFHIKNYYSIENLMIDCSLNKGITYMLDKLVQKFLVADPNIVWKPFASEKVDQSYNMKLVYRKDNHSPELRSFINFVKNNKL